MKNKHILSIKDLSIKDITEILTKAEKFLNKRMFTIFWSLRKSIVIEKV